MHRLHIASIILAATIAGCASIDQLAPPVDEAFLAGAAFDDEEIARLREGRRVYVTSCARCHSPEPVGAYTREEWRTILPRMIEECPLPPSDAQAVEEYVEAVLQRAERRPPSAARQAPHA